MEKLTIQTVIDAFVEQTGVSKKNAEALSKTFFETIAEGLKADGTVKVSGLGTFKVVDVAERESVNVNNGERIVIPGYKKVNFIPAETNISANPAPTEPSADEDKNDATEEEGEEETVVLDIPSDKELNRPSDAFSGIDLIVATPESIADVRSQYAQALKRAEETLKAANEANVEKLRLERLLRQLEDNSPTPLPEEETTEENPAEGETTPASTQDTDSTQPENTGETTQAQKEDARDATLLHYLTDKPIHDEAEENNPRYYTWLWWLLVPVIGLLLACGAIWCYRYYQTAPDNDKKESKSIQKVSQTNKEAQKTKHQVSATSDKTTKPEPKKQETNVTETADSVIKSQTATQAKPIQPGDAADTKRPKTYVMKPGDSLNKVSKKFYGTKDSVRAIIRANKFPNPDNVPVGATVILP